VPSKTLQQRFQVWCADASRNNLKAADYPTTLEGSKRMLDDALWKAYEEGYRQCQEDIKAAIERMG
jgi:hypothetical protein